MSDFIGLAIEQGLAQVIEFSLRGHSKNLLFVVVVNKGLDRLDGCIDCPGAEQGGQGAGDKPGQSPHRQQAAVVRLR